MNSSIDTAKEYAKLVRRSLADRVKNVILFGSQARGDARENSDFDFIIVVDSRTSEIREDVLSAGLEMMNRYDRLFVGMIFDEQEWQKTLNFPLGWNVKQEGILV